MKHKKLKVSALLLLGLGLPSVQAQTMYVKESSDTQTAHDLMNIKKMTFSNGNASIQKFDNSTTSFTLSDISYFNFDNLEFVTSVEEQTELVKHAYLKVYPNPVSNVLCIDLSHLGNKQGTLSITALDGSIVHTQQTQGTATETLNIRGLKTGVYYCQFTNKNERKTVKIIKH